MAFMLEDIYFDSTDEEKYEYIREMQEAGKKNADILVPVAVNKLGDHNLIEIINANEFIERNPHLFH